MPGDNCQIWCIRYHTSISEPVVKMLMLGWVVSIDCAWGQVQWPV